MKKLISLILAICTLTAMCACAEKLREISPDEARELANGALMLKAVLDGGSQNVSEAGIVTENGEDYAPAEDPKYAVWSDFEAVVKDVFDDDYACALLSSGECLEMNGSTYLKYNETDSDPTYSALSFGDVDIDPESNSETAAGTLSLTTPTGEKTLVIDYVNTPDGWRIKGIDFGD